MHAYYRPPVLLLAALTIGCSMPVLPNADPMTSSTQGSTLVRVATVTAVGSAVIVTTADAPGLAGEVVAGDPAAAHSGQRSRTVTELTLRFDNGASAVYRIEPGALFQPGEQVKVMARNGRTTRIAH
ncbi:hypothetical protein [Herminiimonas sp. CN]|uniref:hypothetical protein n=1 Tax=Herminiimonas sp. CN TaxID=1349818 RepID=UPI0004735579|nr:hypothetical protein [Herminiimonas sp. CN]